MASNCSGVYEAISSSCPSFSYLDQAQGTCHQLLQMLQMGSRLQIHSRCGSAWDRVVGCRAYMRLISMPPSEPSVTLNGALLMSFCTSSSFHLGSAT